ncbi:MAG: alpha/beta hydrolase, partial [Planctomycetota bacterium]|nr:alpha/beta hydrolase [Planctomycetota bacterium]
RPGWELWTETMFTALKSDLGHTLRKRPIEVLRKDLSAPRGLPLVSRKVKIEEITVVNQSAAWFLPPNSQDGAVLLFLHGGGFVAGSWKTTDRELISALALSSGLKTLSLDYRLAPEHPFPAALEDVRGTLAWLRDKGYPGEKIVIAGDSAGGNLALAALIDARDNGQSLPAAAALLCPFVDLRCCSESFKTNAPWDFLPEEFANWGGAQYLAGQDPETPLGSPLFADLTGLPPMLIQVGEAEIFRDDVQALGLALENAGNDVTLELWPDMVHVWQMLAPFIPEASEACDRVGTFLAGAVKDAKD